MLQDIGGDAAGFDTQHGPAWASAVACGKPVSQVTEFIAVDIMLGIQHDPRL